MPSSKSLTNRYLLLALLADGPSRVASPLVSRDTVLMLDAVAALGARVTREEADRAWRVAPPAHPRGPATVHAGLAGTVLRFVPVAAALADGAVRVDGDERARSRPLGPLLEALAQLGVRVDTAGDDVLPLTVHGSPGRPGGEVGVNASASSQFVSALLLGGARFAGGLTVRHTGATLPSTPHIAMTVQVLRAAGVRVDEPAEGVWAVEPGTVSPLDVVVEPDLSSAAPLLAAAAVTGGDLTVAGWPARTTQAGDALRGILARMGAVVSTGPEGLRVRGPGRAGLRGIDVDLHDVGELTPVVAALAALSGSPSTLRGVAHLRGHETDRLAALEQELGRLGAGVRQTGDGLEISPAPMRAAHLRTYDDHRMAMAAAVLGLAVPGVTVEDVATTGKTFPGFADLWEELVG